MSIKFQVLTAANYEIPQTRKRVIIVGVKNDINLEYNYPDTINQEKN